MDVQRGDVVEEIKRLQHCINDLVSLLAVPAMWSGAESSQIVHTLLEALLHTLHLDLVYVRLKNPAGQGPIEMVRFGQSQRHTARPHEIGEALQRWLGAEPQAWPPLIPNPNGEGDISIMPLGLGLQGEIGVIVAGSERTDFPRQTERLILSVAANQASIGLQGARLLSEQRRVASELDRRVAQRTAELAAANEELRKEIADRKHAEEDLRSSEEKHRLVVETANDAVVSMDDNGTIQFANPATARILGYDPAELVGRPLTVIIPEFMRELHDRGFRRYLATGHRHINWQGTELTALRKDGREFPVEVSFGEMTRDGHQVFTGFIRDISERKQAADKLRASERSLRELTETIPQMLWSAEEDGTVNYCNQRTLDYTGMSAEEVRGSGWLTAVHPDDVEMATHDWLGSVTSGEAFHCEFRFRRAPNGYRWCISNAVPLRDLEGKVIRWFGTVIDLHDWREAQQALHAIQTRQVAVRADVSLAFGQEESLEAILHECAESIVRHLDAAFARIWTLSRDGRMLELRSSAGLYTHVNGAHSRIPIGQLKIGAIAREQKHVLSNDIVNDPRISDKTWAANEGMSSFAGYPLLVGTRTLGVMAMFSRKPLTTGTAETLASIADLIAHGIERKHAEGRLRASERELSLIIETIPGLVWCAAADGELNYLNRRILDYTGTSSDAWARLGWTNLLHPEDAEPTVRAWSSAVATGQSFETQCRLRRFDGVYRWFQVLGQPAHDDQGVVNRWYGLLLDIDDRKNTEEDLRKAQAQLMRATQVATIAELSASIAHEINQPLAAVVASGHACLRFLAAHPANLADAREAAESIVRDGKDIGEVVRRIRALFKRTNLEKSLVDVNDVIGEVLRLVDGEITKRRILVETDLCKDAPLVSVDRVQLQQLILNLLLNGMEAMDPVHDRPRKLWIGCRLENSSQMLIEVRDQGVGLKDHPDKLFDAFFTTKENGMGMGLAICRSIVEAHNGRLWAAPREGSGATFCFTLPVKASGAS
jgi:PAS domain S-box-containing protein